jgi:colanic acid/amylovoran biosynthesis glycosyltransferase
VIAANSGGVTDIVKDGVTGLLVPERNAAALADAIAALLRDDALAGRLAAVGQAWVRERFSSERVAKQFFDIYQHVALAH